MRKYGKKKLLELTELLDAGTRKVRQLLDAGGGNQLTDLLAREQEIAVMIGNRIEESGEEDFGAVTLLEDYCEGLWKLSQEQEHARQNECFEMLAAVPTRLRKLLEKIPEVLEVVFMPYKASMWDCMESIWEAAEEDLECTAFVVPIPYFERDGKGGLSRLCCEDSLFPEYVPITSYQQFSLKEEKPDIIYIHNPFDDCNTVTCVHPDYFSSELKKYTDLLVYVPYFITDSGIPEVHRNLPAYQNMDRIIVDSQKAKEELLSSVPEEKILVIGSPKLDRVRRMQTNKQKMKVPPEWKKAFSGRKVVFYNTSLNGILKYGERELDKIEDVFSCFLERKDVALLWRPHPLLHTTIASMRPELTERLKQLERWFQKKKIGVLDTTPDVDIAVVLSDAYIGEPNSSVIHLFQALHKPVFYMDTRIYEHMTEDEWSSVRTADVLPDGDDLWFITAYESILCRLNRRTGVITVTGQLPDLNSGKFYQYVDILQSGEKIFMLPYTGTGICVFDTAKDMFQKVYFRDEHVPANFGRIFSYKNFLYLTPKFYPALVRYDVQKEEFTYYRECISQVMENIGAPKNWEPFSWGSCVYGSELFLASAWSNQVILFDMEKETWRIRKIGDDGYTFRGMTADAVYSYMILYEDSSLVRWNRMTDEVKVFCTYPQGFIGGKVPFKNVVDFEKALYLIPFHANHICCFDKETEHFSFADFKLPYTEGTYAAPYYEKGDAHYDFAKKISEHEIAACSLYDNSMVILDIDTKECKSYKLRIPDRVKYDYYMAVQQSPIQWENTSLTLDKYLFYLSAGKWDYKANQPDTIGDSTDGNGAVIHRTIGKEAGIRDKK